MQPKIHYRPGLVVASIGIALFAPWAALWIAFALQRNQKTSCPQTLWSWHNRGRCNCWHALRRNERSYIPRKIGMRCCQGHSFNLSGPARILVFLFGLMMTLILSVLDARLDLVISRSSNSIEDVNNKLHLLATVDTLAGIPNRSSFLEKLSRGSYDHNGMGQFLV
jgi:hypothetical protein